MQQRAEQVLGYSFKNPNLLKEALTHSSIADNRLQSNGFAEFLGDSQSYESDYLQKPFICGFS